MACTGLSGFATSVNLGPDARVPGTALADRGTGSSRGGRGLVGLTFTLATLTSFLNTTTLWVPVSFWNAYTSLETCPAFWPNEATVLPSTTIFQLRALPCVAPAGSASDFSFSLAIRFFLTFDVAVPVTSLVTTAGVSVNS